MPGLIDAEEPLRILVAEDSDTDFLLTQRQIKKLLPTKTLARATCREDLLAALAAPLDLIVTDYHLLDIEGPDLLAVIADAQPDTPCLVLSGSAPTIARDDMPASVIATLEKGDYSGFSAALTRSSP